MTGSRVLVGAPGARFAVEGWKTVRLENIKVASLTDVGQVRTRNEDFMSCRVPEQPMLEKKGYLFLVADGMGGHPAGDVASKMVVEVSTRAYYDDADGGDLGEGLVHAIETANRDIYAEGERNPSEQDMGTTVVGLVLHERKAYVASVGDSRLYLVRQGDIRQVTRDHSWAAMQVSLGVLTTEQAQESALRSVLLRSVGHSADVSVDLQVVDVEADDIFVLCTDGLHGLVTEDEIKRRVVELEGNRACQNLVDLANKRGGIDNITVQIIRVKSLEP